MRRKVEKTLNRNELYAYDKVLINYLQKDVLIPALRQRIDKEHNELAQIKQFSEVQNEGRHN